MLGWVGRELSACATESLSPLNPSTPTIRLNRVIEEAEAPAAFATSVMELRTTVSASVRI